MGTCGRSLWIPSLTRRTLGRRKAPPPKRTPKGRAASTMSTAGPPNRPWTGPSIRIGENRAYNSHMRGEFTLMSKRKTLPKRLAFAAAILAAACHRGDQIAPEGATIVLAANPATIPLNGGAGAPLIVAHRTHAARGPPPHPAAA